VGDVYLAEQSKPSTPAAGNGIIWVDSTAGILVVTDDAGRHAARSFNAAVAAQGAGFASDTYVTNSDLLIPSFGLQAKTLLRWTISASKTAAGVATPVYTVRIGANRTTADTSRLAITGPAQTAAADTAVIQIMLVVRTVAASGVIQGTLSLDHNLAATGFANDASSVVEGTSAGFDNSALGGSYIGLSINGGASAAWTITQVRAEALW
jgi:hypothetical protein